MPLIKPEFNPAQLRRIVKAELLEHPKARYTDIYKLLHQACYGPTHISPDLEAIAESIRLELAGIQSQKCGPYQDIGCGKGFIRLNLIALTGLAKLPATTENLLREQLLKEAFLKVGQDKVELLAQCVMVSRLEGSLTLAGWQATWSKALPVVHEFLFPTFAERALVQECLDTGRMPSHTDDYRYLYKPHYRVIHHSFHPKFKTYHKERP